MCKVSNCFIELHLISNNNNQLSFLSRNHLNISSSSLSFSPEHGTERRNESNTFRSVHLSFYSISYKTLFLYFNTILTENFYYGLCKISPSNILNWFLKVESWYDNNKIMLCKIILLILTFFSFSFSLLYLYKVWQLFRTAQF